MILLIVRALDCAEARACALATATRHDPCLLLIPCYRFWGPKSCAAEGQAFSRGRNRWEMQESTGGAYVMASAIVEEPPLTPVTRVRTSLGSQS